MKKVLLFFSFLFVGLQLQAQSWEELRSVPAHVEVTDSEIKVIIDNSDQGATGYAIYRRDAYKGEDWSKISDLGTGVLSYTDTDVIPGEEYEYLVIKTTAKNDPLYNNTQTVRGSTAILAGIKVAAPHTRGNMLLLVEEGVYNDMQMEVDGLLAELALDGYRVLLKTVHKDSSVTYTHSQILAANTEYFGQLKTVYILGHIPVPYSGGFGVSTSTPPDGHTPDHNGAWPADVYYGTKGVAWTDHHVNQTTGINRDANKNTPGDGKFDQVTIPEAVQFEIGRVDLINLPVFGKSETELLKQYLTKASNYKKGVADYSFEAVIDNNFQNYAEGFPGSIRSNFSLFVGPQNISTGQFFDVQNNGSFLLGYACGGGSYRSCSGVGHTDSFVNRNTSAFNFMFGSYFGDWDVNNSFFRAPLAAPNGGLTNGWSGRPHWQTHYLGLGKSMGEVVKLTQNNTTDYIGLAFVNGIHIALMGDPSLRLHALQPPTQVMATPNGSKDQVELSWTASLENDILGYYIYRAHKSGGTYTLINENPITNTQFTDETPYQGKNYYAVKTVKLQNSRSGSYYNLSIGNGTEIDGIEGKTTAVNTLNKPKVEVYPNPATNQLFITFDATENMHFDVVDVQGKTINNYTYQVEQNKVILNLNSVTSGVYYIRTANTTQKFVKL